MPAYDSGFKIAARTSGRQLADVAMSPVDEWLPVVSEVQTAERFADRAFRARRGSEWFVVYLEAYTYWRKEAPWNLLAKSGLLSERERLPHVCALSAVRFWLQAITSMPNARPIRATSEPILPRPRTPSVLPWRPSPTVSCQPPARKWPFPNAP